MSGQKPIVVDDENRSILSQNVLKTLRSPTAAPKDFDPLTASNADLVKYGFPARPDETKWPAHFQKWKRFVNTPAYFVAPTVTVLKTGRQPAANKVLATANATSSNWSGGVVMSPPPGETFVSVSASWVVPNPWPPLSAWNGKGWNDGSWESVAWVGIDGWSAQHSILQAGTKSVVTVTGGTVTHQCWAWFEWYPAFEMVFSGFPVLAGDTVEVLVCATTPTTGYASVHNTTANLYTSTAVDAPNAAAALQGQNAEWILEDDTIGSSEAPFSDYGAVFFYDCLAATKDKEVNVSNATLVNMVQGTTTVSTAVEESPSVLMTYSGDSGP
ncbi:concanavalin A-like lectin/glucanase [Hyaloscypha variabilis F]|uniref:Concanavalin A-like lectin/glucanase n=1 Tax=Hyaloscypha variabilis (strain UAMH 11265 / GT02V1 / F) TaxID=1149755 RepID=A0A2J6RJF8_HYAVF|nr:concanavalin A-like lectin/glucanase [Hyaloscypha variabilis F]